MTAEGGRKGAKENLSKASALIAQHSVLALGVCAMLGVGSNAPAQEPAKVPRIGLLVAVSPSASAARTDAFRQGLRELGYVEAKNIIIEPRYAEENLGRLPALAAELVRLKVDVIVTLGSDVQLPDTDRYESFTVR